jgi:hypothetical protein
MSSYIRVSVCYSPAKSAGVVGSSRPTAPSSTHAGSKDCSICIRRPQARTCNSSYVPSTGCVPLNLPSQSWYLLYTSFLKPCTSAPASGQKQLLPVFRYTTLGGMLIINGFSSLVRLRSQTRHSSQDFWSAIATQVPPSDLNLSPEVQRHEPLAFLSGRFTGAMSRWPIIEKEAYAIIAS